MPRIGLASCRNLPAWEVDDLPLHRALTAAGWDIAIRPWDEPGFDGRDLDAMLLRTTWDYVPRLDEFLRWTAEVERHTPLWNPHSLVAWNADKRYLRDLEQLGVPTIPTTWLETSPRAQVPGECLRLPIDARQLGALLAVRGWQRAFLKPIVGASAVGALPFERTPEGLAKAVGHVNQHEAGRGFLLQPYLETVERQGEVSVILFDGVASHAVRKIPPAGDFRVQDDYGATDVPEPLSPALAELARQALDATTRIHELDTPPLYARADFLESPPRGLVLVELELIEPSLFLRHDSGAAERFAAAISQRFAAKD